MNKPYRPFSIIFLALGFLILAQPHVALAAAPAPAALFAVPTDVPNEIIRNLFESDSPDTSASVVDPLTDMPTNPNNTGIVQAGMRTLLMWYSYGMLVVGSFLLLYYLLRIVAESAHTGKVGGGANQLWAPIRTVMAIGMLVPLTSGLNSGQMIVLNIAGEGSALASNAWTAFMSTMAAAATIVPPI